jgi:CheY-like chemotaxis protein
MKIPDVKHLFGKAIRHQRTEQGISQEELAGRAGLHRTYISDVERGARNPSLESIEKIASALNMTVSMLFARVDASIGSDPLVEILLIEDDPEDIELTLQVFKQALIINKLHIVQDGDEALQFLFATGPYEDRSRLPLPAVILLDLKLPKIDGLEVLRRIRRNPKTASIPVVVLTASKEKRNQQACRKLGVKNYILKPVGLENFMKATPHFQLEWRLTRSLEPRSR